MLLTQRAAYEKDINASSFGLIKIILFSLVGRPIQAKMTSRLARGN